MFNEIRKSTAEKRAKIIGGRTWHSKAQLEAAPDGTVEQLGMVGCSDGDDVARKRIDLQQKVRNHALDLAGLVGVATFLADDVELVEEKDTRRRPREREQLPEALRGLTKETSDEGFVPDRKERHADGFRDRLGEGCLAVPRRPAQ